MRSKHDEFIGLIGSLDIGDDIERQRIHRKVRILDIDGHHNVRSFCDRLHELVVLIERDHNLYRHLGSLRVGPPWVYLTRVRHGKKQQALTISARLIMAQRLLENIPVACAR